MFSCAISSSVSMQSAAKPGVTMASFFDAVARQRLDRLVSIGLDPLGTAEARLEGELELGAERAERRAQGLDGVAALLPDRDRPGRHSLRQAVERGEDRLGLEIEAGEMRPDRVAPAPRYRRDRRGKPARCAAPAARGVSSAHRRPCRWLSPWSQRHIADRAGRRAAGRNPAPPAPRCARRSSASRSASPNRRRCLTMRKRRCHLLGLAPRDGAKRRLVEFLVPDRAVFGAAGERPLHQHDAVQDQPPQRRGWSRSPGGPRETP